MHFEFKHNDKRPCKRSVSWLRSLLLFILYFETEASLDISGFSKHIQDFKMASTNSALHSRSVLECAKLCAASELCCGYNFLKVKKECVFLAQEDLQQNILTFEHDTTVFVHRDYMTSLPSTVTSHSSTQQLTSTSASTEISTSGEPVDTGSDNSESNSEENDNSESRSIGSSDSDIESGDSKSTSSSDSDDTGSTETSTSGESKSSSDDSTSGSSENSKSEDSEHTGSQDSDLSSTASQSDVGGEDSSLNKDDSGETLDMD